MGILLYFFLILPLVWSLFLRVFTTRNRAARLPPGPRALPIIGNILDLGKSPHESVTGLSKVYGPLMSLKLGTITTIVVSSPQMAKEVLQKQDSIFSGRTVPAGFQVLNHHNFSMAVLPPTARWRHLRTTVKENLFSPRSLNATRGIRQKTMQQLVAYVQENSLKGEAVDIGRAAFTMALNLISNTFFSKDLCEYQSRSAQEFSEIISSLLETGGQANIVDFFPVLKWMDPRGIIRKSEYFHKKLLAIIGGIVDDRRNSQLGTDDPNQSSADRDFLDVLLKLSKEDGMQLTYVQIKHLLMDLFIAGTDTVSSTVEWAMAELLKNPNKMAKAKAELKNVIENSDGIMEESDISKLPYLEAVVKETLRLHSPIPFLIPHKAQSDAEINGFFIPENAQIFINVWGMGRDPNIWPDPLLFRPERFLDNVQVGTKFELIPFGAGRRMCPGQPLGSRMLHSIIGSLLLSFDWKLDKGILKPEDMDMSASFGFTLQKTVPLKAIPIKVD